MDINCPSTGKREGRNVGFRHTLSLRDGGGKALWLGQGDVFQVRKHGNKAFVGRRPWQEGLCLL